jgi:hypothetical protein
MSEIRVMSTEELEDALTRAGRRLADANTEQVAALTELGELVRLASAVLPSAWIANLADVPRPTVDKMLDDSTH